MIISIKELRKLIRESYSYFESIPIEIDWYEDDEKELSQLPSKMRIPEYLVDKLKETQSLSAFNEIEQYILKSTFRDKWNDPAWVRKFSWDFHPDTGLMLNGTDVLETNY